MARVDGTKFYAPIADIGQFVGLRTARADQIIGQSRHRNTHRGGDQQQYSTRFVGLHGPKGSKSGLLARTDSDSSVSSGPALSPQGPTSTSHLARSSIGATESAVTVTIAHSSALSR